MEEHQRSLADFLLKTAFALLTALGGLTALLTGLVGGLEMSRNVVTIAIFWVAVALLLVTTILSGRVMTLPRGAASDAARAVALKHSRRSFVAALCVLMIAPLGSAFGLLSPEHTVTLAFAGATENKIEVVRGRRAHVGLLVQNTGPRLQSHVSLVAPTDAGIATALSVSELALEPSAIGVVGISWRADSSVELGSYVLGVHLTAGGRILAARSVEMVVTDALRAAKREQ